MLAAATMDTLIPTAAAVAARAAMTGITATTDVVVVPDPALGAVIASAADAVDATAATISENAAAPSVNGLTAVAATAAAATAIHRSAAAMEVDGDGSDSEVREIKDSRPTPAPISVDERADAVLAWQGADVYTRRKYHTLALERGFK